MTNLMKAVAICGLIAATLVIEARASEPCAWAALTVASKHLGAESSKNYNESNWGLGGEHCVGTVLGVEVRGAAGFFRNSNRVDSFYFGGSATFFELGPAKVGIAALRVSGYELDPINAVFPVVAFEGRRIGANFSYFPKTKDNVAAIGLQLKWRWR